MGPLEILITVERTIQLEDQEHGRGYRHRREDQDRTAARAQNPPSVP
jgi:hypothetical protein